MFRRTLLVLPFALALSTAGAQSPDKPKEEPLTAKSVETIWTDFGNNDDDGAKKAAKDTVALVGAPQLAVPFFKDRLKPVPHPDAKKVAQWLQDIDDGTFQAREKAAKELEALGPLVAPALERKLAEKLALETQRRVEGILAKTQRTVMTIDELRAIRAIEVLRGIGTPEAVAILEKVAQGAEGSVQTAQARQAVAALKKK